MLANGMMVARGGGMAIDERLIFDIGCNNGDDAEFYLAKGFRVVAVDADQAMCDEVSRRFQSELAAGRLQIIRAAVTNGNEDTIDFFISDRSDWNSADPYFVERNAKQGISARKVAVPTVRVADLMASVGTPYYMKIDIEGMDIVPVQALRGRDEIPPFISIELADHDQALGLEQIEELRAVGYTRFQFFNQGMRTSLKAPQPPLEGSYVPFEPHKVTSGLFGKELAGKWLGYDATVKRFQGIAHRHRLFRDHPLYGKSGQLGGSLLSKLHNRFRRHFLGDPVAWYDLHATY